MTWIFHPALTAFDLYRLSWDHLNCSTANHVLLDSLFVAPLIHHFGSADTLLGISEDHNNPGLVLVNNVALGIWRTFQPSQEPLGLILLPKIDSVASQIQTLIRSLPGYALSLSVLQQDPDFTVFQNPTLYRNGETLRYIDTARLTLKGTFEAYWKGRGRNIVHNLSRQRRRLSEQGVQLALVADRDASQVAKGIQEYGKLESTGWKASEGTAVTADNRQGLFYREMLEGFCARGEGIIYRLLADGKTIGSNLCLERNGMMVILKTAYDESIKGVSPGLLMHQELSKTLFAEGKIKVIEFYGRVRDWHTKWTDDIRTMYHLNFYRHGWVGAARRLLKPSLEVLRRVDSKQPLSRPNTEVT